MAVVQNPIIGRARGSVATTTFTTWKGLNVIKAKPISVANPQSAGQVQQRGRLRFISRLSRRVGALIRRNYAILAVGKTSFNAFSQDNFGRFDSVNALSIAFPSSQQLRVNQMSFSPNNLDLTLAFNQIDEDTKTFSLPVGRTANEFIITRVNVIRDSERTLVFNNELVNVDDTFAPVSGLYTVNTAGSENTYVVFYERATRLSKQFFFTSV